MHSNTISITFWSSSSVTKGSRHFWNYVYEVQRSTSSKKTHRTKNAPRKDFCSGRKDFSTRGRHQEINSLSRNVKLPSGLHEGEREVYNVCAIVRQAFYRLTAPLISPIIINSHFSTRSFLYPGILFRDRINLLATDFFFPNFSTPCI